MSDRWMVGVIETRAQQAAAGRDHGATASDQPGMLAARETG